MFDQMTHPNHSATVMGELVLSMFLLQVYSVMSAATSSVVTTAPVIFMMTTHPGHSVGVMTGLWETDVQIELAHHRPLVCKPTSIWLDCFKSYEFIRNYLFVKNELVVFRHFIVRFPHQSINILHNLKLYFCEFVGLQHLAIFHLSYSCTVKWENVVEINFH